METIEIPTESAVHRPHYALAVLMAGSAAIHFAMAPAHFSDSALVGLGFLAAAWFQAALAVVLVARPNRSWLAIGLAGNAGILTVWLLSRTIGVPLLHGGEPEAVAFVDLTAVVFEACFVVGAAALLAGYRPANAALLRPAGVMAVVATVGLTGVALASPVEVHAEHEHGHHEPEIAMADPGDEQGQHEQGQPEQGQHEQGEHEEHEHSEGETAAAPQAGAHHHAECTEPVSVEQHVAADEFIEASNATVAK